MSEIIPFLIGGLVLFLYAITQLSEVMKAIFSENAKGLIAKYTSNLFNSLFLGILLTILLGSSSAVIILVIVFIHAKTLTFKQSLGFILGANIGTTFSSQIISLDIGKYAIIPLFLGLMVQVFVKNKKWRQYGNVLLFLGMLFFGLFMMEESVMPLRESEAFYQWIERVEDSPLQGTLIGGLITLIIQSSSGTVGMAIVLGKQKLLLVTGGIAIMLGAELGTCSDTLLATINGSRQGLKAGLFHLFYSLITIVLGLILFVPFVNLVERISQTDDLGRVIANAHMLFNILGVLIFLPFVGLIENGLNRLIKEKVLDDFSQGSPILN